MMKTPTIDRLCESAYDKMTPHERLAVRLTMETSATKLALLFLALGLVTGGLVGWMIGGAA